MTNKKFIILISSIIHAAITLSQAPDTVFIRQDKSFDDTLIYAIDTIPFASGMNKHILMGTTILPATQTQMEALGRGLYLDKVVKSNCMQEVTDFVKGEQDKINSIISTDTTLIIDISIHENCCYEFLCDVAIDSTDTIHLNFIGYGSFCACDCCYGLTYHFTKLKYPPYSNFPAVMINDNRRTTKSIKSLK